MKRILLVEDHRSFSESFAMILDREPGLHVVERSASASACRDFLSRGEGFDLAIVDMFLPDGKGIDLLTELRESCPEAPALVLTVSVDSEDHRQALEAGADRVLSKASPLEEILEAINSVG
ncbi:MAG: response regulator transcription factor [Rubrobacteraceae bacterium]